MPADPFRENDFAFLDGFSLDGQFFQPLWPVGHMGGVSQTLCAAWSLATV
jgi:hypothetical protein